MPSTKLFQIPKKAVWDAFEQSKKNEVIGIDREAIRGFGLNRKKRLYGLREQLSSGNYVPSPLRIVYKRKRSGGWRALGIPIARDHIIQTILRNELTSKFNILFHPNSFFHKKGKGARRGAALKIARKRCLRYNWALVVDVKDYGYNINHQILMSNLRKYIRKSWVLLYTNRMLKAPTQMRNGSLVERKKGLPHDETLSYFLADFYLHDIFDQWMKKNHPNIPFERWIDDIIIHCNSKSSAKRLLSQIKTRFSRFRMIENPKKTKIVYCKDSNRKGNYINVSFNFLEYTFRSRIKKTKSGRRIAVFSPW